MWPAIIAALVGAAASTAGGAMTRPSSPKPPSDRMQSFQEANQQDPLGGGLGTEDILAKYLRSSGAGKGY